MTVFASDTFTDTNGTTLASHTPTTSGGTWSRLAAQSNAGSLQIAGGARVRASADGADQLYLLSATPAPNTADYDLTVTIDVQTNGGFAGGLSRWSSAAADGYCFFYDGGGFSGSGFIRLWRYGGSGTASLGTYNCGTLSGEHDLKITTRGTAVKVYLDGTERISVTETSVTRVGQIGIRVFSGSSTGDSANAQVTTLLAEDLMPTSPALTASAALPAPAVTADAPNADVAAVPLAATGTLPAPTVTTTPVGDDFTEASDTALGSHTPTGTYARAGTSWSQVTNLGTGVATVSGTNDRVYAAPFPDSANYVLSYTPPSANYSVSADFTVVSNQSFAGLFGRWITSDAYTGYSLYYKATSSPAILELAGYTVAGGGVVIGTYSCGDLSGTHNFELRMVGSTISAYLDGVQRISVTDTKATLTGQAGVRFGVVAGTPASVGAQLDNFLVTDIAVDSAVTSPALAATASLPAPTVTATVPNVTVLVTTLGVPLLLGDESPLRVNVALPTPVVVTSAGSANANITAVPLAVSVTAPAPTVVSGAGPGISAVPLAASVTLPTPIVSTTIGGALPIQAPPLAVTAALPAPFISADIAYYWLRTRRSSMSAPIKKTYVEVQAKGTARTATWTSPTYKAETEAGILVVLDVTAASGTGGLTLRINAHDQASSQAVPLNAAPTAVTATGTTSYALYPFGAVAGSVTQATSFYLPRMFSISVTHGDSSSYTYSVGFSLLP